LTHDESAVVSWILFWAYWCLKRSSRSSRSSRAWDEGDSVWTGCSYIGMDGGQG
jgi:hypothetical protein